MTVHELIDMFDDADGDELIGFRMPDGSIFYGISQILITKSIEIPKPIGKRATKQAIVMLQEKDNGPHESTPT